jgi:hypothetical protein
MTDELQALWENLNNLLIYPARDIEARKCSVGDKHSFEGTALAFFNKLRPAPCLRFEDLSESGNSGPSIVCAVEKSMIYRAEKTGGKSDVVERTARFRRGEGLSALPSAFPKYILQGRD